MKADLFSKWLLFFLLSSGLVRSQCISTFPALENFEAAPVWTINGVNSDWAWGTPAHPTINTPGGGLKSWCVGGLAGSFYNYSELAWIQSPCYNLSTLNYPWVSFKIFWECERQWDGVVLQSSINGGATWQNVGAFGDPVDCNTANWFNYGNITWLTSVPVKHGWTGRIGPTAGGCTGGFGSGGWVVAKHCLTGLANQSNVIFRFLMGSGTTCNSFDGLAFDDFYVSDGMAHAPNFSITCTGAGNFNFTAITPSCPVTSSYSWNFGDPGSGALNVSTLANPTHVFSTTGIFTISLTTAGGGCNPPGTITQTLNVSNIGNAVISQSINCFGGTGNASVSVIAGPGPNGYTWSPSGGNSPTSTALPAGNYSVSVSDGNGCVYVKTVTITQPPLLTSALSFSNISCNGANNGGATVTAGGGSPAYSYSWLPSGGTSSVASGLAPGSYTVLITDSKGCTTTATVNITQPSVLTAAISSSNVSCNGGSNGSATVIAGGGTPAYTYSWMPSGGTSSLTSSLSPGSYTVLVTDNKGCTVTAVANITQPPALTVVASSTNIACNGTNNGVAMVNVSGGTPGYTYSWVPAGGSSSVAAGLSPGSYTVTVTDNKGCSTVAVTSITQPPALVTTIAVQNAACGIPNGGATVTVNGGTPGYTYSWSPAGGTSSVASNLAAGNYSCQITDNNGCVTTVTAVIAQPVSINPVASVTNVSCFGGQNGAASLTINGGTAPYTYTWSPSPGMGQGTNYGTGLSAQVYTVQISDALLCSTVIIIPTTQPAAFTASVTVANVSCNGANNGSAIVNVTGGTPAYSYSWQPSGATSQSISSLGAGSYTAIVTDNKGCTATAVGVVIEPATLSLSLLVTNIPCFGLGSGSATVTPTGGTPSYNYTWTPSGGNSQTESNLSGGNYTVLVKDINNCPASATLSITQPAPLVASISPTNILCFGNSNGAAQATVSGGTAPYSYSWSPGGGNVSLAQNLSAGGYTVLVKDVNNCAKSASVTISQPQQLQANVNAVKLCAGQSGALTANVSGGVAPYTYVWNNNAGTSVLSVSPVANAIYTLLVTDANGCSSPIDTAMVTIGGPLSLSVSPATTICAGQSTSLSTIGSGGIGNYQYTWIPGSMHGTLITVTPGSTTVYTVTVSDGCTQPLASQVTTVFVEGIGNSTITSDKYEGCAPFCVKLNDPYLNGTSVQSVLWTIGDGTTESGLQPLHCFSKAGTYTVSNVYSTKQGCTGSGTLNAVIVVHPKPKADYSASEYTISSSDPNVQFINMSTGATSYLWDFGGLYQAYEANPSHDFSETGIYLVALVAYNGSCSDTTYKIIECLPGFTFYAPNTFTPNDDNINDRFLPKGEGWKTETYQLRVFDRWGEQIFHTQRYDEGWDGVYKGKLVKDDEYVWKVTLMDIFNKRHEYAGIILVLK